ncbi:Lysophospholipase L1 [Flavobacterium fryxellicola]|uniref:Acylhydrolase n=1 Tax=Flavobacterium fryxellicola TaxID=249352 RepID=A0A167WCC8_9FLAO|nr:SGNH/GDSL hydrolase family protein [Flavobacterium fryxellicola]OAB27225.1 acylhydrolase [Flavobacterium fryxellicola]SHN67520.1 Lysophospholipase L1 [Flavobacterium fryxellicola]
MKKIQFLYSILFLSIIMGGKAQAQDWPNLNKYQVENAQLKPVVPGEKRIVLMGDSITEFWSTTDSEYFIGKPYLNRGISGQTTPQMLLRFRADVIDLKPSAVVILAGINDIAGNTGPATLQMIANNIFSMVDLAHANHIKVILCSVLPAYDFPWKPNQNPAQKVVDLNKMIKNYADAKGILYLDYFSAMRDERDGLKSAYSADGVHPNKLGYQIMAPLADKAISQVVAIE